MGEVDYLKTLPKHAFFYWPSGDKIKTGADNTTVRFIFYKTTFTSFELENLENFKNFIAQKNPSHVLPPFFTDPELLRILLGCKFNLPKAFNALISSISWRKNHLQNSFNSLFPFCSHLLDSGSIYFHGRDHRFRPLIIINLEKFDLKQSSIESFCSLLCFLLEFAVQKLMLPGQIENWFIITDLCNKSLMSLPFSDIKRIIKVLQDNFRCRMVVNFVLNAPRSVYYVWSLAKKLLEEHTIKKIRIERTGQPDELFRFFNRGQVEEKYGGTAENLKSFWPPVFPEGSLEVDDDSIQEYLTEKNEFLENFSGDSEVSSFMGSASENVEADKMGRSGFEEFKTVSLEVEKEKEESDDVDKLDIVLEVEENLELKQEDKEEIEFVEVKKKTLSVIEEVDSKGNFRCCRACSKRSCAIL